MKPYSEILFRVCSTIIIVFLLSSCSHRIIRTGYSAGGAFSADCKPATTKTLGNKDSLTMVGQVELKDSGFSTACSESHAMLILVREACSLNANVINITEERRADVMSSCYRCKAEFYKDLRAHSPMVSDPQYQEVEIVARVAEDRKNTTVTVLVTAVGVALGFILASVLFR